MEKKILSELYSKMLLLLKDDAGKTGDTSLLISCGIASTHSLPVQILNHVDRLHFNCCKTCLMTFLAVWMQMRM